MSKLPITDDDLHAWADNQLAPERRIAVEQAMARDPSLANRTLDIQRQNAWLRNGLHEAASGPATGGARDART